MPRVILESKSRSNDLIGLIGTNAVGKTPKLISLAEKWRNVNDGPVMSYDPQNKLQNVTDFNITLGDDSFIQQLKKLKNALLILDDVRVLHPKNQAAKWLMDLTSFRTFNNIDIFYAVHNPSLVLNLLSYYTTKYYVFYTESTDGSWEKKIPNYSLCLAASMYINRYVSIKGRGTYPDFPHVMVDNQNRKLTGVNIIK